MKRFVIAGLAGAFALGLGLVWWRSERPAVRPAAAATRPAAPVPDDRPVGPAAEREPDHAGAAAAPPAGGGAAERSRLADELNAPNSTVVRDLSIVDEVLGAWQTNFPKAGNPVGENAEITAALTGANPLRLALVPPDHPALNPRGELCDRWGTPFFFHQLGARRMEIRSAGPDRLWYTADDAVLAPAR